MDLFEKNIKEDISISIDDYDISEYIIDLIKISIYDNNFEFKINEKKK